MRIVAGALKGLRLTAPEGRATRPTGDRAREGLFNVLSHGRRAGVLEGATVADLFAGVGAVGLEALSRGAARVVFYETGREALQALAANVARCRAEDRTETRREDAFRPRPVRRPFDLVFLDPPYSEGSVERTVAAAAAAGLIGAETLVVAQLDPKAGLSVPAGFAIVDDRRYGAARFVLLERVTTAA